MEQSLEKPTLADKIFLVRQKITKISRISKHIRLFHVESGSSKFIVKFSYGGNTQYHKLTADEAQKLVSEFTLGDEI